MKKAFTLVEMLTTVILIGAVAIITYPIISNTISSAKIKAYNEQVKLYERAAENWAISNYSSLSKTESTNLTIQNLKESGYLKKDDNAINPNTGEIMDGCVFIKYNVSYDQYEYNYFEGCEIPSEPSEITFSNTGIFNLNNWAKEDFYVTINEANYDSYKYCVGTSECEPTTEVLSNGGSALISTESATNYVCAKGFNLIGETDTICTNPFKLDKTIDDVGNVEITGTLGNDNWYTSDVTITPVNGTDSLSGHNTTTIDKNSININGISFVTVTTTDLAENSDTRNYIIKIDKNSPTISVNNANVEINQGNSNTIASYFTINQNGISSITSTTCVDTNNSNTTIINTSSLNVGTHNITCTVTKENGLYNNANISITVSPFIYTETGINSPDLLDNMVPVKYVNDHWVYADINSEWYNYNDREWANAVILKSGVTKTVGQTIAENDIALWYVWIPRYKYTIFNGNNGLVAVQQINVTFESGTYSSGTVHCTDQITAYDNGESEIDTTSVSETCSDADQAGNAVVNGKSTYTHPAFTLNGHQLTGIWVGKFEVSTATSCTAVDTSKGTDCDFTNLGIEIKPNVTSWRGARVGTFYTAIKNMSTTNNDSHMMKNMEWGAVAYLTKSQYGLGTIDIGINNYSEFMTGCGADAGSGQSSTCNSYDTVNGMKASTTGNIYGIYDMSGGAYEYTAGNMAKTSTTPVIGYNLLYNSGFAGIFYNGVQAEGNNAQYTLDLAYTDLYSYDKIDSSIGRGKLGDATKEALTDYNREDGAEGWNDDYAFFPCYDSTWFIRGGYYINGSGTGIMNFYNDTGMAKPFLTTRAVLSRAYTN